MADINDRLNAIDDMTYAEAKREHERLKFERDQDREEYERTREAWKAQIIGSPVEMDRVISLTSDDTRMKIMRLIANLTDAGLELSIARDNQPAVQIAPLAQQTLDMVQELAEAVKQAIEEYINED